MVCGSVVAVAEDFTIGISFSEIRVWEETLVDILSWDSTSFTGADRTHRYMSQMIKLAFDYVVGEIEF